jgi:ABC-type multidrug transport system ATPase subunit
MTSSAQILPPAYFGSLTLENVKCFQGKHEIDLSDKNDKNKPAMWTVILGNNNTGKTTLLRCLADLEPTSSKNSQHIREYTPKYLQRKRDLNPPCNYKIQCKWLTKTKFDWFVNIFSENETIKAFVSNSLPHEIIGNAIVYGYGTARKMGNTSLTDNKNQDNAATLFEDNVTLTNAEEWLLQTYFAEKLDKLNAKEALARIKEVLISGILPDVQDFRFDTTPDFKGFVEIKTDYGWVKLRDLGYGYQVTLAWVVDLAKKMFERYPNPESGNPLHEPAIVLVDEIDLHLHPEWQRKIIQFLRKQFPKTQFIVTTHSPLIIQSMDDINLVLLEKEDDHVIIKQPDLKNYQGWTVEEILSDLMGLDGRTKSETYYKLIAAFNKAALKDDYDTAKKVYDELEVILNRNNPYRELLDLQLSRLSTPESA